MENLIVVDAEYVDRIAFNLIVNFERMLERRVPEADLAVWLECLALDGGLGDGDAEIQVVLIHEKGSKRLTNFCPGHYEEELNGKAFKGRQGEFSITTVQTEEMASKEKLLTETLQLAGQQPKLNTLMVVAPEAILAGAKRMLFQMSNPACRTTLFTLQPMIATSLRQESLGYSLMAALGISGKEIDERLKKEK